MDTLLAEDTVTPYVAGILAAMIFDKQYKRVSIFHDEIFHYLRQKSVRKSYVNVLLHKVITINFKDVW